MNKVKSKLFRKVNTKTYNVHHNYGESFKRAIKIDENQTRGKMKRNIERGLDYTPLFKFLLSKVGKNWDEIFSEAKSRLNKTEPIFWMVALNETDKNNYIGTGESSYFSGLYVDESNILQKCDPTLTKEKMKKFCNCCTHTFNGEIY
ncbi:hypothetical protein [Chryseobacterium sp. T1]